MRTIILFIALIFSGTYMFGQQLKIVLPTDLTTDISGTTVEAVGDKDDMLIDFEFRVIQEGAEPLLVKYRRYREVNSGRTDQICDNQLCYSTNDFFSYTTPAFDTLFPGTPALFKPQIIPGGEESCAIHNYMIMGENGEIYDSIRVIFRTTNANCVLSLNEEKEASFSISPNPVQDVVTLKGEAIKNGGTIVFLDALGKEVKRSVFSATNNQVNVSELRRGVYFVSIYSKEGTRSTVQRLIKQ